MTNEFRESDKVMMGKTYDAPWMGGFGTSLRWKGLQLSAQFSWIGTRYVINNDRFFEESGVTFGTAYNQSNRLLYDRWKNPGDITDIPRWGEVNQLDDRYLENASFLRMKNLSLSYSLPQSLLSKTKFFSLVRVYAQHRTSSPSQASMVLTQRFHPMFIRRSIQHHASLRLV